MIASLGMYDWPEVRDETDALWSFIAARLRADGLQAPSHLSRFGDAAEPWLSPTLVLAQTCGYPYATGLRGEVRLVGTPCYDVPGCRGAWYSSMIIASRSSGIASLADLGGATVAVNSEASHSGHWALRAAIAATPRAVGPRRAILSGSHRQSVRNIADGVADLAAIDAVSWALAERHEPEAAAATRIIARSPAAPGLPLITALGTSDAALEALREAIAVAASDPALQAMRHALFLSGFEVLAETVYDQILELRADALSVSFPAIET